MRRLKILGSRKISVSCARIASGWKEYARYAKIHLQICHVAFDSMFRALSLARITCSKDDLEQMTKSRGRGILRAGVHRPIVRTYVPVRFGSSVGLDIMHPTPGAGSSAPYLICVDPLGRFAAVEEFDATSRAA